MEKPTALREAIEEVLGDLPRAGCGGKFTAEQITQIIAVACEPPDQALEPNAPTKPMRPGQVERREFEYTRHGTQTLIGNFEVATGEVIAPTVQ